MTQLAEAVGYHQAGRLDDAETIYREILSEQPNRPDVLHLLGALRGQTGQIDSAIELISRAINLKSDVALFYDTLARNLKMRGRLDDAIVAYRRALQLKPDFVGAMNNFGVALRAAGLFEESQSAFRDAIAIKPDFAEAHNNLGNLLIEARRFGEAIAACRRATAIRPNYGDAFNNLGNALMGNGLVEQALTAYRQALRIDPNHAEALNNLGIALYEVGSLDESISAFHDALRLRPTYAEAHNNLGNTLRSLGQLRAAIAAYQKAIEIKPAYAQAHNNLGVALWETNCHAQAVASCRTAIELNPDFPEAHNSLGNVLKDRGELDDAVSHYHRALELNPSYAEAHNNLAVALKDQARIDEAMIHATRAITLRPNPAAHSNLIYLLHFHPDSSPLAIKKEQANWYHLHAEPLAAEIIPREDVFHGRRLRIGYITPYFRRHVVGLNILPLLREHNHEQFEVYCYSDVVAPDAVTAQCTALADQWRNIAGFSDARVAQLIRQDQIDILIDLSLHLSSNRLMVLARKPAPVQATFGGYPAATGLRTIDYRITDPLLDPPGQGDSSPFERPVRIDSFWCYDETAMTAGMQEIPHIGPPPALAAGHITFGCLNNFCKVNGRVLELWARVLLALPDSHLILLAPEGIARKNTIDRFTQLGVEADRIEFVGHQPRKEYLAVYNRIDVGLDTFPYNGHTTSLDSLWMGVPVVTLAGNSVVGRAGVSQLSNLGLNGLIAASPDEFVRTAIIAGSDLAWLVALRASLRQKMRDSVLMDAKHFAAEIESAYRMMRANWSGMRAA